jgi:hypothetical protein
MEVIGERLDYLWFLDYGLDEKVPDHSVLSKARARVAGETASWTDLARLYPTGRTGNSTGRFQQCPDLAPLPAHRSASALTAVALSSFWTRAGRSGCLI